MNISPEAGQSQTTRKELFSPSRRRGGSADSMDNSTKEERTTFLSSPKKDSKSDTEDPMHKKDDTMKANNYESTASAFLRYFFLVSLCLQNASYTLLRRLAVGVLSNKASDSSILIAGEAIKLGVSLFMTFSVAPSVAPQLKKIVYSSPKMFVPAVVYYAMNRLSFVALRRIDAGTFTVCAQLKTLTTAGFSFVILGKTFSAVRVRALIHLVCSVIVISEFAATHRSPSSSSSGEGVDSDVGSFLLGLMAVLTEVSLSGMISVYYEKVLKDDKQLLSVWDRNIQLSIFSILLYFPTFHADGYFVNWSSITMVISCLGASGGLLVAFSMKYTDAILKALATSGAIVLASIGGALWLSGPFGIPVAVASVSVCVAIFTYITDGKGVSK